MAKVWTLGGGVCLALAMAALMSLSTGVRAGEDSKSVFYEAFETSWEGRWIVSESSEYEGKWKYEQSEGNDGDYGLLVSEEAKKYGIAIDLPETVDFTAGKPVVLQYDLRLHSGLECGGAYLKFLIPQEAGWTPSQFDNTAPYSIMFGPDRCGSTNKVHFIFRHKNPKSGEYVEHHLKSPPHPNLDKISHVYTAVIYPNNTVTILIDGAEKKTADLLSEDDFTPSVVPRKTIPDPEDTKPETWDSRIKIPDPEATKPEDWDEDAPSMIEDLEAEKPEDWLDDEPDEIDDPEAVKPEDWNEEEDGEWETPKISNPKCEEGSGCGEWTRPTKRNPNWKGKWSAPKIDNPDYDGVWEPREIDNPDWFELEEFTLQPIAAIGIEIWTMQDGILFDNILVTYDEAEAAVVRETSWKSKFDAETVKVEVEEAEKQKEASLTSLFYEALKGYFLKIQDTVFQLLYKISELPFLASYKEQLTALLEKVEEKYKTLTVAGIFATLGVTLFFLYSLVFPAAAKYEDISVPVLEKEDIAASNGKAAEVTENVSESLEGTVDNAELAGEIEKEEEPNAPRRRHRIGEN